MGSSAAWLRGMAVMATLFGAWTFKVPAQDPPVHAAGELINGPAEPADFAAWFAGMKRWRAEQLKRIGYDGAEYNRPELKWTQSSYMQPQMMIQEIGRASCRERV